MTAVDPGIRKRSVVIAGHRTSVSLEQPFWEALGDIARARGMAVQALVGEIDAGRARQNLSSALRLFVLDHVRGDRFDQPPGGCGRI